MFYPVERPEQFPVVYMVGGVDGLFPGAAYSTVLSALTSHGYIVAAPWALMGVDGADFSVEAHLENIKWVRCIIII